MDSKVKLWVYKTKNTMEVTAQKENINCIFQVKIIISFPSIALQKLPLCHVNLGEAIVCDLKLTHTLVNIASNNLILVLNWEVL